MARENGTAEKVKPDESPVFDLSRLSYRDDMRRERLSRKLKRIMAKLDAITEDLTVDDDEIEALEDRAASVTDELVSVTMQCVVSLPERYTVPDAPLDVDWSDPSNYHYLRNDALLLIGVELVKAQTERINLEKN